MTAQHASETPSTHIPENPFEFQGKRFRQIAITVIAAFAVVALQNLLIREWLNAALLLSGIVTIAVALRFYQRGSPGLASQLMLGAITLLITALMWVGQGVHDTGVLAYPGILVVACMLLTLRQFLVVLGFMLLALTWFVVGALSGLYHGRSIPLSYSTLINAVAILTATAATVWLLASDLRRALAKLRLEVQKVSASQAHAVFLATHDPLTSLPNRLLARDRIEHACAHAEREHSKIALLHVDLDGFKSVNDALGHSIGDGLLIEVAKRLKQSVRDSDTVSRQGSDEFLIVIGDIIHVDDASTIANKLLESLTTPFRVNTSEITTSCSIGIAIYPEDGKDVDSLLKKADIAMHQAKEAGRNVCRFFAEEMNANIIDRLHLLNGMRNALVKGEFILHYQPLVALNTGKVIGAEALIRWRHGELGLIPPARFIPVAESTGLIVQLGAWVLREACRQAAEWRRTGMPRLVISVNLSPAQFKRGDIEQVVCNALDESGLPPSLLELELTESILIQDTEKVLGTVRRLKELGVGLSIDDFGTGYSSLSYLSRFQVDKLKIDQSFVRKLTANSQDAAIVRAIIQMAQSLKLGTVAEGIEDEETLAALKAQQCEQGQGYLFARPLPPEEFQRMMMQGMAPR